MECFIELWSVKDNWTILSQEERSFYLKQIGPHLQSLLEKGVEIVSWGKNDKTTSHRGKYDFFAVWKFPTADLKKEFEALVMEAEWYTYFHQENVSGTSTTPDAILAKLIEL